MSHKAITVDTPDWGTNVARSRRESAGLQSRTARLLGGMRRFLGIGRPDRLLVDLATFLLEECPEELLELRATLLQKHVWRQREGLWHSLSVDAYGPEPAISWAVAE